MIREPAVAGQFYPSTYKELIELLKEMFIRGPGKVPEVNYSGSRKIIGGIVPHAGYIFSGHVAAHFYYELAIDGFPETVIIIGPNHHGIGAGVATTFEDFKTPLGVVRVDKELAKDIVGDIILNDPSAHRYEHSIEVQLPFILFLRAEVKFVPISMYLQDISIAKQVGEIIREACRGKDVVVIASSDFSHYVPKDVARKKDMLAIEKIVSGDVDGFYKTILRYDITVCGYGPIISVMSFCNSKGSLLKYATSGDVYPMEDVVGYASIKFER